jgi:hypothetical protein
MIKKRKAKSGMRLMVDTEGGWMIEGIKWEIYQTNKLGKGDSESKGKGVALLFRAQGTGRILVSFGFCGSRSNGNLPGVSFFCRPKDLKQLGGMFSLVGKNAHKLLGEHDG